MVLQPYTLTQTLRYILGNILGIIHTFVTTSIFPHKISKQAHKSGVKTLKRSTIQCGPGG